MQKFLTLVLIVAVLIAAAVLLRPQGEDTRSNRFEDVKKSGVLRCGYADFPPYFLKSDKGEPEGIMVDLMNEIGHVSGLKIEWAGETTWGTIPADLNLGKFDVYCANAWLSTQRAFESLGTQPVGYNRLALYKYPHTDKSPAEGRYQAIDGTMEAHILSRLIPKEQFISLPGTISYPEALRSLAQGKADYELFEEHTASEYNRNNPNLPIEEVKGVQSHYMPIVLMVGKNDRALADFLNAALTEIDYMGVADEIWRKHNRPGKIVYYRTIPK